MMDTPGLTAEQLRVVRQSATAGHHPRLWLDAADRDAMVQGCRSGLGKALANRLIAKCEAYLDKQGEHHLDLDAYDSDAIFQRPGQYALGRIMGELALAGWLFQENRYLEPARRIVLRRAREAFKTTGGSDPNHSHHRSPLGIGCTGAALAWTADLLRPTLGDRQWTEVVAHVRDYYLAYARLPFFDRARRFSVGFNKTLHGMCAIGELTLLVAEDLTDEELSWGLGESLRSAIGYCREAMDDDGGTFEGPGYGASCVGHAIQFAEALRRHGLPEFSRFASLQRHGRWLMSFMAPKGGTISVGDSHGDANITPALQLLARWSRDPGLQWGYLRGLGREDHSHGPFGDSFEEWDPMLAQQLAFYDPGLPAAAPDTLGWPLAYHTVGSDFVSLRSGWSEQDVLAVLIGQGRRSSAEAHLGAEAGALDLYAFGNELLHDPGYGLSTPEAHSTVQVAEQRSDLQGGNARFAGRVIRFAQSGFAALAAVDMAQLRNCRWASRDLALLQGDHPYLVVADDVNYRSDWAEFDWFWQVPPGAEGQLPQGGQPARIVNGPAVLDIFSFTVAEDAYPKPSQCAWHLETCQPESWCGLDRRLNRLRMRMACYCGVLLTVLWPRRADQPSPTVQAIEALKPGVAVTIRSGLICDTIMFQPYTRLLQTQHLVGTGRLAVVREQESQVRGFLLDDGFELNWRGQALVPRQERQGQFIAP